MNEAMTQILNAATPILCLLITAGGAYLVALLKRQTAQIEKDLDNETATKYMNMAVDAVAQAVAVQQGAKLHDIIRQMLRRHAGVFGKRNRLRCAFCIAEQAHGFFTHRIDTFNTRQLAAHLPANHTCLLAGNQLIKPHTESINSLVNQCLIITSKFHNVQPEHLFIRHIGNQLADGMPDNIFPRQIQHF